MTIQTQAQTAISIEDSYQKQIIIERFLISALIIDAIAFVLILLIHNPTYPLFLQLFPLLIATSVEAYALMKAQQGHYNLAVYLFLLASMSGLITVALFVDNTEALIILVHILGTTVAAFFLNRIVARQYALLAILIHATISQFQASGPIPQPNTIFPQAYLVPTILFLVTVVCGFMYLQTIRMEELAKRKSKSENELLEANGRLNKTLEALQISQNNLLIREQEFSALFENTPLPTVIRKYDKSYINVNQAFLNVFGFDSLQQVLKLEETNPDYFNHLFGSNDQLDKAIANNQEHNIFTQKLRCTSGIYSTYEIHGFVGHNTENKPDRCIFQCIDITKQEKRKAQLERHVAERTIELRKTNEALQIASTRKDSFLATMSHELRTPLNTILSRAQALQLGVYGKLEPKQVKTVTGIENSGNHLLKLINDVLDVSKIAAGEMSVNYDEVIISDVCNASVESVRALTRQKSQSLLLNYQHEQDTFIADEKRVRQILDNLLANAIKFTPEGKQIGLTVTNDDNNLIFTVWDEGIGVSKEKQAQLFKPFVQIDNRLARAYEGTGLGLSLVKKLVDIHGGSISIESKENEGAQFEVILPLTPPSSKADSKRTDATISV